MNSASHQGPGSSTLPWILLGKRTGLIHEDLHLHLNEETTYRWGLVMKEVSLGWAFESWSDNIQDMMVRTVKCLIFCSMLGLIWGLAEMDRQEEGKGDRIMEVWGGGLMDFASLHPISGGHADLILYLFWQTAHTSGKRASCAENREIWV